MSNLLPVSPSPSTPPGTPTKNPDTNYDTIEPVHRKTDPCPLNPSTSSPSILTPPSSVSTVDRGNSFETDSELPDEPYYDYKFQRAIKRAAGVAIDITDLLGRCPRSEPTIAKLAAEALRLSTYNCPVSRSIGVVGQSGQGKSSLINSLLDVEDLAITGENGQAVTAFVIEYKARKESQSSKFFIEAYCLTPGEINEQLGELLDDYLKPYNTPPDELTAEQFKVAEERSEAARYIFEAAFSRFSGIEIEALKDQTRESSLASLRDNAKHFRWPDGMKDGTWTSAAETPDKCHELMEPFLDEGLWPFLKSMSIYLESRVLSSGVVLADLPGYHDVNFARVSAARRYQSTCDELFVVVDIKRAIDNPIIKEVIKGHKNVADGVGKVTCPNITAVCTYSADISISSKNLRKPEDAEMVRNAKAKIEHIKGQQFRTFAAGVDALEEAKLALKSLHIRERNEYVKKTLQETYTKAFGNGKLPVFCVDNAMYSDKESLQALAISGIPFLRRHTLSLPGKALFKSADSYLDSHVPALVTSLKMWLEAGQSSEECCLSGDIDLEDWFSKFDDGLSQLKSTILKIYQNNIKKPLANNQQQVTEQALQQCYSWHSMHHSSFKAFINKNGTHCTPTVGYKCWNTELVGCLNSVTAHQWAHLDEAAENQFLQLGELAHGEFDRMEKELRNSHAPKSLLNSLIHRKRQVEETLDKICEELLKHLRIVKHQATSGRPGSYVLDYMRVVYRVCQPDNGKGVTARNHNRLEEHVSRPDFVGSQVSYAYLALEEIFDEAVENVSREVSSVVSSIKDDLKMIESPSRTLMKKYPEYVQQVESTLKGSMMTLERVEKEAQVARDEAKKRCYISSTCPV